MTFRLAGPAVLQMEREIVSFAGTITILP